MTNKSSGQKRVKKKKNLKTEVRVHTEENKARQKTQQTLRIPGNLPDS